jgi:hypothetical protein
MKGIKQQGTECRTCEENCPNQVHAGVSCAQAVTLAEGNGMDANRYEYSKPAPDNSLSARIINSKLICLSGFQFVSEPVFNNSLYASCCG